MTSDNDQQVWGLRAAVDYFSTTRSDIQHLFRSEALFLNQIAPNLDDVLDVGCACGNFVNIFRSFNPAITYTGVDACENMISKARSLHPDAQFAVSDAHSLKNSARTYDLVFSTGVLVVCPDYLDVLQSMWSAAGRYLLVDLPRISTAHGQIGSLDLKTHYGAGNEAPKGNYDVPYVVIGTDELRDMTSSLLAGGGICGLGLYGYESWYNDKTIHVDLPAVITSCLLVMRGDGPLRYWHDLPEGVGPAFEAACSAFGGTKLADVAALIGTKEDGVG